MKFGRTYTLTIEVPQQNSATVFGRTVPVKFGGESSNAVVISYPLTLDFEVQRSVRASLNSAMFRIYNLKDDTRRRLTKDRWQNDYRQIRLEAGYETDDKTSLVFQGNVLQAHSYRVRHDWITEIEALDGGFGTENGQVAQTFPAGFDFRTLLKSVIGAIPNVGAGAIGTILPDQNSRGISVMGNAWESLTGLVPNAQVFIDNEQVNILNNNDCLAGNVFVISSESGLLGTPRRFDVRLDATMIFEPRLKVGMMAQLISEERYYNGIFKVTGIAHRGVISGAVSGEATTVASLDKGTALLVGVGR